MEVREKMYMIELGKDLFLKGFDEQLVGVKKNDIKILMQHFQQIIPKKNLQIKKLNSNVKF